MSRRPREEVLKRELVSVSNVPASGSKIRPEKCPSDLVIWRPRVTLSRAPWEEYGGSGLLEMDGGVHVR